MPKPPTSTEYQACHMRVRRAKGRAAAYQCIDQCGRQAKDWSYNGGDPDEITALRWRNPDYRYATTWGTNPAYYVPRCRSCHWKHDHQPAPEVAPETAPEVALGVSA